MSIVSGQSSFEGMPRPLYAASPSKLLAFLDCPRRYRFQYLDHPRPVARAPRAHTSMGTGVHNALRDWWDLPLSERTPHAGGALVGQRWISAGFRDDSQSQTWRQRMSAAVTRYLTEVDPAEQPRGLERTVSFVSGGVRFTGRVDRLDEREGGLVVVDYKTSLRGLAPDEARTSLALALYAAAVWKMWRRRTVQVELHHIPTGQTFAHEHTDESLSRKVRQAGSIAQDAQRADDDYAAHGTDSDAFPPVVGPLCMWCDFRAHCPQGRAAGPEKSGWAALTDDDVPYAVQAP